MTRIRETSWSPAATRSKGQGRPAWALQARAQAPQIAAQPRPGSLVIPEVAVRATRSRCTLAGGRPQCWASWSSGPRGGPLARLCGVSGQWQCCGEGPPDLEARCCPDSPIQPQPDRAPFLSRRNQGSGTRPVAVSAGLGGAAGGTPGCRPSDRHSRRPPESESLGWGLGLRRSGQSPRSYPHSPAAAPGPSTPPSQRSARAQGSTRWPRPLSRSGSHPMTRPSPWNGVRIPSPPPSGLFCSHVGS